MKSNVNMCDFSSSLSWNRVQFPLGDFKNKIPIPPPPPPPPRKLQYRTWQSTNVFINNIFFTADVDFSFYFLLYVKGQLHVIGII